LGEDNLDGSSVTRVGDSVIHNANSADDLSTFLGLLKILHVARVANN
jgi:hypothetical protein